MVFTTLPNLMAYACSVQGSPELMPALSGKLAYQANDDTSSASNDDGQYFNHIYLYDFKVPSNGRVRVDPPGMFCDVINPKFSADGGWLLYAAKIGSETSKQDCDNNFWQLYVQKLGGYAPFRLQTVGLNEEDPSFTPNGSGIVFKFNRQAIDFLSVTLNSDGTATTGSPVQLLSDSTVPSAPFMSPTGRYIYYSDGTGDQLTIRRFDMSNRLASPVIASGNYAYYPIPRDESSVFYTRHKNTSSDLDQLYVAFPGVIHGPQSNPLATQYLLRINDTNAENSDPTPIGEDYLAFSRTDTGGSYHMMLGDICTGKVWSLKTQTQAPGAATIYNPLGASYFLPPAPWVYY